MPAQMVQEKFKRAKRFQKSKQSIWTQYGDLYLKYRPVNLGQGYSDYPTSPYITDALAAAAKSPNCLLNQYAREAGHPRLVEALSTMYSKLIDRKIDPYTEILITSGAYEALHSAIHAHIDEGDEIIIIEPFYDCYERMLNTTNGVIRYVPLRLENPDVKSNIISANDYILDSAELEATFNEKTKMIIINNPNNPLGKVYTREELMTIADLCKKYNVICVSDEVYEWVIFDDYKHVRICSLPGMWDRTITISSGGKIFSVSGWKVGWAFGGADLISNLLLVHQDCISSCPTPIQEAIAVALEKELECLDSTACFFVAKSIELQAKRDFFIQFLNSIGMKAIQPHGGYFIIADWSRFENEIDLSTETDSEKDFRFTKWMIKNVGVQMIPPSAFYNKTHKHLAEKFVRICFFKRDENLQKGTDILKNFVKTIALSKDDGENLPDAPVKNSTTPESEFENHN